MDIQEIKTLGALKRQGYVSKKIKSELRENLIQKLKAKQTIFDGIICLLYTSPSPRDLSTSRMPSSA